MKDIGKPEYISFDEFAANLSAVFVRVVHDQEVVVVERNGVAAVLRRIGEAAPRQRQAKTQANYDAFLSSAGAWKDLVDTEKFIKENYEQRNCSTRPPIEL